ncbi:hypothetical protein P691DRAFT_785820 [Macrolepiota fuliginosa MF-IS2]|uniref:Uncharacterized protein n=1 Tax=Macrolepiota fuliginosa MF-IS2 TaxID=1400762 RepID=A0A9P6C0V7_9AGAR|nr:hypothetical protein P691DRAFT_785820 [Macrolepiota fuliginosa MF-IS2]
MNTPKPGDDTQSVTEPRRETENRNNGNARISSWGAQSDEGTTPSTPDLAPHVVVHIVSAPDIIVKGTPADTYGAQHTKRDSATSGLARKVFCSLKIVVTLLVIILTTIISLGVPYWYYRYYRLQKVKPKDMPEVTKTAYSHEEQWQTVIKRFKSQWKAGYTLSSGTLPIIFPMLAIFPITKCTWAFLLAAVALLSGLACLVITMLYRNHLDTFQQTAIMQIWSTTSQRGWTQLTTQRFWVFLSLPTIWLLNSICTLMAAIILSVWEQTSVPPDGCLTGHLHVFRATALTVVVPTDIALRSKERNTGVGTGFRGIRRFWGKVLDARLQRGFNFSWIVAHSRRNLTERKGEKPGHDVENKPERDSFHAGVSNKALISLPSSSSLV